MLRVYCKKCNRDLTNSKRLGEYYSCEKCDMWTNQVTKKDEKVIGGCLRTEELA